MDSNRFAETFNADRQPGVIPVSSTAFMVCPVAVAAGGWCAGLYQLAFQQAQAAVSAPPRARDLFGILN